MVICIQIKNIMIGDPFCAHQTFFNLKRNQAHKLGSVLIKLF